MSNTSYSFKENSHVIVNQGGEKKVMKKILSVALSTAMAFSMFASVAFGADAKLTPEQQFNALKDAGIVSGFPDGLSHLEKTLTRAELAKIIVNSLSLEPVDATSYNDKNYANHWGRTYIEAATQAGILNGKDAAKKLFDPNGAVTVQELAKVLVTALKLEVPADANNTASAWAKGYVAAAVNAGYLADGINYQAQATRSQAVVAAYAIYEAAQVPTVKSYKVVDSKNVEFTLSNDEVVKVTLEKALEANKETEVTFKTAAGEEVKAKITWVVTTATKVESVKADNLKQVIVSFDGDVDSATATDEDNYSITSDTEKDIVVTKASLSADKKVVTLTVEEKGDDTKALVNQKEYKLSVSNVRAGNTVISASDVKFTPVDAALPVASSAQALGNKAIKITFSEPVVAATNSNSFLVDGKAVVGTVDVAGNTAVLKLYSVIENGEHTINVSGVKDYSGLANLSTDLKFTVVEDKTAPTIANVESATFESVTLKFSEPVDPSTVSAANVYWLQGTTKRTAETFDALSDDTYRFNFTGENKFIYSTNLYVTDVQDYSGNVIASDTKVTVNPVVDVTRPEIVSAKLDDNSTTELTVKFTKSLDTATATDSKNYVIKNSDGDVVSEFKDVTIDGSSDKVVHIKLYEALSEGKTYTLSISNVADNTTLKNVILPYSTNIAVGSVTAPKLTSVEYTESGNRLVVTFDKAMATSGDFSVLDPNKYIYQYSEDGTGTPTWKPLPSGTNFTISSDAKSVVMIFPSSVDVTKEVVGLRVTNVKSTGGVTLDGLTMDDTSVVKASAITLDSAKPEATAKNKIKVHFAQTIQAASTSDFKVVASDSTSVLADQTLSIISASVDGKDVILTLSDNYKLDADGGYASGKYDTVTVFVEKNKNLVTPAGNKVDTAQSAVVVDKIAPEVSSVNKEVLAADGLLTVNFSEAVLATATNAVYDFDVQVGDTVLKSGVDFTIDASSAGNKIVLAINPAKLTVGKVIKVRVNPAAKFLTDISADHNVVTGTSSYYNAIVK
ncbi:Ig-like domain-containing protein [Paenibacillus timonensis]|uniref:Ig-like domain-containing protein n=1 Tax=Paenibacillus timonensis TaxID=225915 RepID=A0ABW3SHV4_9BACL|nr:Ig-like domain-containing protein [Paenibacillus timonensis]MCH1642113.1 Ig-like domain-containing protein [Paenibacillus timonensis]